MSEATAYADHGYTEEAVEKLDTQELLRLYKETGDEALKWPVVLRYTDLIKSAAIQVRGVYSSFAQVDDIVNEGILTLLNAIDKYDPGKGVKFETYVSKRIRGMVIDLARKQDWIPRTVRQRGREIDKAISELTALLGRHPTEGEVAEKLGITKERYQKDIAGIALSSILSLDMLMDAREADDFRVEVPSRDAETQPEKALETQELQQILAEGIQMLSRNEQIVLSLYYEKNLHMKEIAQVMDLSSPRISQIHARAIQKLRDHMEQYFRGTNTPIRKGGNQKCSRDSIT